MLIRKIALLAPAFASIFGASQVEAGCFGKRNCCQATPIVCPPCAPVPNIHYYQSVPAVVHSTPPIGTPPIGIGCAQSYLNCPSGSPAMQCPQFDPIVNYAPAREKLEAISETVEETYTVQVPYYETGPNGETITKYRSEQKTRTLTKQYETETEQINYLKRKLGELERNRVDPLEARVKRIEGN